MTQKILVISGKKQAGKNTISNFIEGLIFLQAGLINEFEVSEFTKGELRVKRGNQSSWKRIEEVEALENTGLIGKYEFADKLKLVMKEMFGLSPSQVDGSNGEKDTLTRYVWENMPGLADTEFAGRSGPMTARQLTQYVGGNILRRMDEEIHIRATYNKIKEDGAAISTIVGGRYPKEITFRPSFAAEVKTIRLARNVCPDDQHSSETSLDVEQFNWNRFDAIIWNQSMSIEQTCAAILAWLRIWNWVK